MRGTEGEKEGGDKDELEVSGLGTITKQNLGGGGGGRDDVRQEVTGRQ